MTEFVMVGDRAVGPGHPCYVIAEIGSNHDQSLALACEMIQRAAEAGADAVKFQSIRFDRLYSEAIESADFRTWFRAIELDERWYQTLADTASAAGVDFLSSPTYPEAVPLLEAVDVKAYKLASPQVQANLDVVRAAARTGKPLFMSTGYCTYGDVAAALKAVEEEDNAEAILLHCVSKYPVQPGEANLRFMQTLASMSGNPVGFSDHSLGIHLPMAAIALGACVLEKHVTHSREADGPDHHFALHFDEFARLVRCVRDVEAALGDGTRLDLLADEHAWRAKVALKLVLTRDLGPGERLGDALVTMRANPDGILASEIDQVARCRTTRALPAGALLQWSDLVLDPETSG